MGYLALYPLREAGTSGMCTLGVAGTGKRFTERDQHAAVRETSEGRNCVAVCCTISQEVFWTL